MPMARLPSGFTVTFSGTTPHELLEEAEGRTRWDHDWAWAADTDTDGEDAPFNCSGDPAVADHPAVADLDTADSQVADMDTADSAVASPRNVYLKPRSVRLTPASECGPKLYKRVEDTVFNVDKTTAPAMPFGWTRDLRRTNYHKNDIPCRTFIHGVQMATYVISKDANAFDLAEKLRKTKLQIIVLVLGSDVCKEDSIYGALHRWARHASTYNDCDPPAESAEEASSEFLENKRVVALGPHGEIFAVLHKGKVRYAMFEARCLSCCEDEFVGENVHFGTLTVHLTKADSDQEAVRIGVILARERLTEAQIKGLAQWIILHRVAVLTGFIGESHDYREFKHGVTFDAFNSTTDHSENNGSPLTELAKQSGAIGGRALYQMLNMALRDDDERIWALPVPFLFFGFYTKIREPAVAARYYLDAGTNLILSDDVMTLNVILCTDFTCQFGHIVVMAMHMSIT